MDEELKQAINEIRSRITAIERTMQRDIEIKENSSGIVPRFVESSPDTRTYQQYIEFTLSERVMGHTHFVTTLPADHTIYIMGYFDQVLLDKLIPLANHFKIIAPDKENQGRKNSDALERISKAGAEVRIHPMVHARIFCYPAKKAVIIGSGDIQTNCFGGTRFDAGIWSSYTKVVEDALAFFNKVWTESTPLEISR